MKTSYFPLTLFFVFLGLQACDPAKKIARSTETEKNIPMGDNSMTSLDWDGVYTGTLPCADCPGIQTLIKLNQDLSFTMQSKYLDKSDEIFSSQGTFTWDDNGGQITLKTGEEQADPTMYSVGENRLVMLDRSGDQVTGDLADKYVLNKLPGGIEGKYWKLIEINGQKVPEDGPFRTEPHLFLDNESQRATGNGGCNSFTGGYELNQGMKISFAQMAATRMACPEMDIEDQLLDVLQKVDNYAIKDDHLTLSKAKMAPLARFEAVYLR